MASRGAALVTGGARRIGRVLAATAAEAGYDVAIHVRTDDGDAGVTASEVRARGRKAAILACDLRKESATVALVGEAETELGPITLLVNCASVFEQDAFGDMNRASWDLHM
jgi:NAD(P)-dependent dehydrogenase (short-subunit alcohol dehydrogenase family)